MKVTINDTEARALLALIQDQRDADGHTIDEHHAHCQTCGECFPISTGRGRPRAYCDDECRQVEKLLVWIDTLVGGESMITKWGNSPEGMKRALVARGRLWSSANLLNPVAKGYRKAAK